MSTRKQIRVYIDVEQWLALKPNGGKPENDTDTLKRILAELEQLRSLVGQLAGQDVGQLSTMFATLSEVHSNPLIALGMCLERYRQSEFKPVLQSGNQTSPVATASTDNFIDNSEEF